MGGRKMARITPDSRTFAEAQQCLALRMRELRTATNMSQVQAASRAGINRTHWGRLEAGTMDVRLQTLLRVQYALGVDSLEGLFSKTTGDLFGRDPMSSGDASDI